MSQIKLWNQGEKPLDLPLWSKFKRGPWQETNLDDLFTLATEKHIVLVENQEEHDYLWGLQLLYGQTLRLEFKSDKSIWEWQQEVPNIFLTYDPWDF